MATVCGKWTKLDQRGDGPGARSSHAIAVVGMKAYAFGGEFSPRIPVDNNIYVFDLETLTWSVAKVTGEIPPPRVGVTMAALGEIIYFFGGRDGTHKELNEFFSFDTKTNHWSLLSRGDVGPPPRSYHSMTSDDQHVYVFGGCGVSHRLNDLWGFDTITKKWFEYPSPGDICKGRGGAGLVVTEGKAWVIYGFAGMEMNDVHCFDLTQQKWLQVETSGEEPSPRSVFSTGAFGKHIVICGGEVDPSDLGHMGAGKFSGETYVLDTSARTWSRLDDEADSDVHPGPRGWCAYHWCSMGKPGLLILGGNSPTNDRLSDMFFFNYCV